MTEEADARREAASRERFLAVVQKYKVDPERPATSTLWSPSLEAASHERIVAIQEEKLAAAFDYLFECSPYHRRRFEAAGLAPGSVKTLADLRRVPVTRKLDWIEDIAQHPPYGTFSPLQPDRWRHHGWMIFSTSGTTRQPRIFRHTLHDREMWAWMCARALWSYGVRAGDSALNCFYYGPSVAAWGLHNGLSLLGCPVVPAGSMPSDRRVLYMQAVRPAVLLGTPSTLLTLGHRYQELGGVSADAGVRLLVCAGEPGASVGATKKRLETMWNARVHDDFGCTEVAQAPLGYTCTTESTVPSVHFMEDTHIVEVLDPVTLEPVPDGTRGTLVVSNLYSEAAPFLRFDMGDWVSLSREPCDCGRLHARAIGGLLGRNDHCLKIRGLQFFPSTFEDALRCIPDIGDEYRIEVEPEYRDGQPVSRRDDMPMSVRSGGHDDRRRHRDLIRVVAEVSPGSTMTKGEVARRLQGVLGIQVEVELCPLGALPRTEGKGMRFIDRR
jgi:phenylacetate-CoA ligase